MVGGGKVKKKRVVVLLSTYNGEKYLEEQIESILSQKASHQIDLMIRDDGSSDGTVAILKQFEEKYPSRIRIFCGENIGYVESYFKLIKMAEGYEYYALSDQDDVWKEEKIQEAVTQCEKYPEGEPVLYASSSYLVNDKLEIMGETQKNLRGITWNNLIIQNIFPGHAQVFNDALCQILKADEDYSKIYVHDFWITCIATLYGRTIFDNQSHTLYRQHGKNAVGFGQNRFEWIRERMHRIYKNDNQKIAMQTRYFYEKYGNLLDEESKKEFERFIVSQQSFLRRLGYLFTSKVYRQKKFETFLFKLLYLFGGYNCPN